MSAVTVFPPKVDRHYVCCDSVSPKSRQKSQQSDHVEETQARKEGGGGGGHPCKGGINSFTRTTDCRQQVNPACFNSLSASAHVLDFDHKVAAT